jgi:hypothetical protein
MIQKNHIFFHCEEQGIKIHLKPFFIKKVLYGFDRFLNPSDFIVSMDSKSILTGLLISFIIGAAGVFFLNQSNVSRLNSQITNLEDQAEHLNNVIQIKQELIDSQQDIIGAVEVLEAQVETAEAQLVQAQLNATALIGKLHIEVSILNKLAARQTYRAEDPNYVSEINFIGVYGNLSFDEWWELNEGPYEEWLSLVYT